jgi:hypothetical protein
MTEHQNRQAAVSPPDQHSVHFALAFLFGAMDRQAPQKNARSDSASLCINNGEGMVPS